MKNVIALVVLMLLSMAHVSAGEITFSDKPTMKLQDGDIVALCGDSITSDGFYPGFLEIYQLVCCPTPKVTLLNFGRWGETAKHFPPVMDKDVIPAKPTVAAICYGMNNSRSSKVMSDEAAKAWGDSEIITVVKKFKDAGVRLVVLASPGVVDSTHFTTAQTQPPEPGSSEATQKNLALLGESARRIAEANGLIFADMHNSMIAVMAKSKEKYGKDYAFAGGPRDGVHPRQAGHLVMAWVYLKALGYDGNIGTITYDLAAESAIASADHKILSAKAGSVELESNRYPFCFLGNPNQPTDRTSASCTRSIVELFPFNQDLNRFMLVVKGAKTPKLKVTWGTVSKEFDAKTLAGGINLAAEFLDGNPFIPAFQKIYAGMVEKNACFKWLTLKQYKNDPSMHKRMATALENMKLVPVKHTIKIEAVP